jgi:hypothetical protein
MNNVRERDGGDAAETQQTEALLKACDEVLDYHERAGDDQAAAAREVRAKRAELRDRLASAAEKRLC